MNRWILIVIFGYFNLWAGDGPLQRIAILEHKSDDPDPVIRPLFDKYPAGWRRSSLTAGLYGLSWKVVYAGKPKGTLNTAKEVTASSSLVLEISTDKNKIPIVEQPLDPYVSWAGKMQTRPLIALKEDFYKDPEGWKRCEGDLEYDSKEKIRRNFKSVMPNYDICDSDGNVTRKDFNYKIEEIEVEQSFCNTAKAAIFKAWLTSKNTCDNSSDLKFQPHWHYMASGAKPKHLGAQIRPLEAGDFDGDGKSEWIFIVNQGSADGYRMYLNEFTKMVEKVWKL